MRRCQRLETDLEIKNLTTFKIGGKIKQVYFPETCDEFLQVLNSNPDAKVLGNISNTLVSSDGYDGTLILTTKMNDVQIEGCKVIAQCGIKNPILAQTVAKEGLSGFEFMIGFPGTLGGNIFMNASAHGQCVSDNLISVTTVENGKIKTFAKDEMGFSYRHSNCFEKNLTVLSAEFKLEKADKTTIEEKMKENLEFRKTHQPNLALPNCGSVFKNSENESAGKLLDSIGAKEMKVGAAKVWENHANFIINTGNCTSTDILELMSEMQEKVNEKYGIKLIPEIRYLGNKNKAEEELCRKLKIELI